MRNSCISDPALLPRLIQSVQQARLETHGSCHGADTLHVAMSSSHLHFAIGVGGMDLVSREHRHCFQHRVSRRAARSASSRSRKSGEMHVSVFGLERRAMPGPPPPPSPPPPLPYQTPTLLQAVRPPFFTRHRPPPPIRTHTSHSGTALMSSPTSSGGTFIPLVCGAAPDIEADAIPTSLL